MAKDLPCGAECLRGLLLLLNVIFILVGLTMIGLGIYLKVDKDLDAILSELASTSTFEGQSLGFLAFVMIGGGVFTVLVSLVGCVGALRVNSCLLLTYVVILAILMVIEFVGFIMAFAYKNKLEDVYRDSLTTVFGKALMNNDTRVMKVFHQLEDKLDCCGVNGKDDYSKYHGLAPPSCFQNATSKGCSTAIIDILETNLPIVGGVLGAVLVIELGIFVSAIALRFIAAKQPYEVYSSNPAEVISNLVPGRRRNYRSFN